MSVVVVLVLFAAVATVASDAPIYHATPNAAAVTAALARELLPTEPRALVAALEGDTDVHDA